MIRNRNVQVIVLSGLLLGCNTSAFADPTSDARKTIASIYQHQASALQHKNVDAVLSSYAPDYVDVDTHGHKITLAETRQSLTQVLSIAKSIHGSIKITQFSLKKNVGLATVNGRIQAVLVDPKTKKTETVVETGISKDTWIKTKSGWRQIKTQEMTHSITSK